MEKHHDLALKWKELAIEDLKMAKLAEANGLYLQSMFHIQQSIEKTIKGLIIFTLKKDPPYSHDLVRLIRELKTELAYPETVEKQLSELNPFYISARYPSYRTNLSKSLSKDKILKNLNFTEEVLSWLELKLKS